MGTKNNPGEFDCLKKADPDEPVFVLLARDPLAADLVREWARRYLARKMLDVQPHGPPLTAKTRRKAREAMACADAMDGWRRCEKNAADGNGD